MAARRILAVLLAALSSCICSVGVRAQTSTGVAKFDLPESGLAWSNAAHPSSFFDVTGRHSAIFGHQDGRFEAWIYPIKLLHGFRLEFQQEGTVEAVRGETCLEQVITRPESTTLVYVHPLFTVRQIIWAPMDDAAIVMFFEIDSAKPLTISAKFIPDFKPMWPASFGGQNSYWNEDAKAFALSDISGKQTALVGSPAVTGYTQHMDWALKEGELVFQIRATPEQARREFTPIVMVMSMESEAKAREVYSRVLAHARELFEQRATHFREFGAATMKIETPDAVLNRAFEWSKFAIDSGWVCHATYGCGIVAGYGPAESSERPGFDWWFGGDAMMSSWALEDAGDFAGARQALQFLKARQRADGKMMHEMTQSVDLVDWFNKFGFAYYHADTTPMYLYSLGQYLQHAGDKKFLDEFWPSARKAYEYCVSTLDPNDGLMDNTKAGLAAVEVGVLRGKVVKDIYLEGFWLAALESMETMASIEGDEDLYSETESRLAKARASIEKNWWNPEQKYFAFGLGADGARADMIGNWPSVMLALANGTATDKAADEVAQLASPEIATDWGARWLSNKSAFYDPVSYNNGTSWPFMNTFVSWAEYNHGNSLAGFASMRATAALTGIQSPGYMPEHMNGDRDLAGERSVPHQLFSSVGVLVPIVRGLFGLEVTATAETPGTSLAGDTYISRRLYFHPRIPAGWPSMRFSNFSAGADRISGEVVRAPGRITLRIKTEGHEALGAYLSAPIPLGARVIRATLNGKPTTYRQTQEGDANRVEIGSPLSASFEFSVTYEGGIEIVPPPNDPAPGERSAALKIMRVTVKDAHDLEMEIAGLGGRKYSLDMMTSSPQVTADDLHVTKISGGYRMEIPFDGAGYVSRTIHVSF